MTMRSVLLSAAAGIAAIGTAQAADLPMTKGEAVEYVKVCSAFGSGFFYIPGTDTCLKIGGEIRAKYYAYGGSGFTRNDNRSAFDTQARIWFDARTETEWGLLRSYFQINADSNRLTSRGGGDGKRNDFTIDKAFIQFGGLTAGYAHSFFGFYDNEYGDTLEGNYYGEINTVNLLAYTAQFGGGFSATLSIEDGRDHRVNDSGFEGYVKQGGQQVPDIVGTVRWDQDWGSLSAQAAGHQFRTGEDALPDGRHGNKYGWAAGATGLLKIPAINGWFVVEGQYADGALEYLGAGSTFIAQSDYFVNRAGRLDGGKGWSITGELSGAITPQLQATLVGSYIDTSFDKLTAVGGDGRIKELTVSGNLVYTIVKGLKVGAEVAWTHGKLDRNFVWTDDKGRDRTKYDNWLAGMRITRTF